MKIGYSAIDEIIVDIKKERPRLIFLTGKTCSGKTFMSGKLVAAGYQLVALDTIVSDIVMPTFNITEPSLAFKTYRVNGPAAWADCFVQAARADITAKLKKGPVVVEGALANNEMIASIFKDELKDFLFIFLQPVNVLAYADRIRERFEREVATGKTGLPKEFFRVVDPAEIANYRTTKNVNTSLQGKIIRFAEWSLEESGRRRAYFLSTFPDIIVVDV